MVVRGPPAEKIGVSSGYTDRSHVDPKPKRVRTEQNSVEDSSEGQNDASQNTNYGKNYSQKLSTVTENESEEDSEEEQELLIEKIVRESLMSGDHMLQIQEGEKKEAQVLVHPMQGEENVGIQESRDKKILCLMKKCL